MDRGRNMHGGEEEYISVYVYIIVVEKPERKISLVRPRFGGRIVLE
jgi:hypothetical protein